MLTSLPFNCLRPIDLIDQSFLWGAGGDLVYGEKVANGFSWVTGDVAIGATGLDPKADHGFLSVSPAIQTSPFRPNYRNGPVRQVTPPNMEPLQ